MIEKNNTLEKLDLTNCKLNGENILSIFSYKGSKGLKHIILNLNEIGDMGLVGILGFIKNSPKLEILELTNIGGNDMGFTTLFNCVKNCENIKKIYFGKNNITNVSLDAIKKSGGELKNKELKIFLDKIESNKDNENIEGIGFI